VNSKEPKGKIIFITLDITLLGGIERVISVLTEQFVKDGYDVDIYSIFKVGDKPSYKFPQNVNITYLTQRRYLGKLEIYYNIVRSVIKIRRLVEGHCVISTLTNISCIYGILNYFKYTEFIAAEHSQYNAHSFLVRLLRLLAYKKSKYVVPLTEHDVNIFSKFISVDRIKLIHNPSSFKAISISSSLASKRLVSIGRLVDVKNYSFMLQEIAPFLLRNNDWCLEIYGDGELKSVLSAYANVLGISQNVKFNGFVENVNECIAGSSFYLCSSKTEAFPMAFLEALSLGIPIISVNCPFGPREIINDGFNGYLLDSDTTYSDFYSCLQSIKEDELIYNSLQKEAFASAKKYEVSSIVSRWYELISI
jgi:glycosyltransferase involved in cell wall biosynthesis